MKCTGCGAGLISPTGEYFTVCPYCQSHDTKMKCTNCGCVLTCPIGTILDTCPYCQSFMAEHRESDVTNVDENLEPTVDENLPSIGSIYHFGGYHWRILDVQDGKALLLSENILEKRTFHKVGKIKKLTFHKIRDTSEITWENCTLRSYLNGKFLDKFNPSDKELIIKSNTEGTIFDHIFLLSREEAKQYLGKRKKRIALYDGMSWWWWLRSPICDNSSATAVDDDGKFDEYDFTDNDNGVRPALWLKL